MRRVSLIAVAAMVVGAAPAAKQASPPPIANYWMDVSTTSGLGAGMAGATRGGGRPSMEQIMGMMSGRSSVSHMLDLRLASRTKPAAPPEADHWIPPGLQMGERLPLVTPVRQASEPGKIPEGYQPRGRMLIYAGCGEHAAAPVVIDLAKMAKGQVPPEMMAMGRMQAHVRSGPTSAPGFGEWPNPGDRRTVPPGGSLVGAHQVKANYAPTIAFSLGQSQDFMAPLGLVEAGTLPSGASRLRWNLVPNATGYALAMFGGSGRGDMIMWTSGKSSAFPTLDYLAPAEVKRQIAAGAVLPPSTSECLIPAEVVAAVPAGMVMAIGYGPEVNFAENPKNPKWTAKVRFKTTASLMRGLGGMMGPGYSPQ